MIAIVLRRLVFSLPVVFIVLTLSFLMIRFAPGSPFASEKGMSAEVLATLNKQYHLNGSIWEQYGHYLTSVLQGNLGISTKYRNRTVNEIIAQTLPVSFLLGSIAYLIALGVGLTFGALAAVRHNRFMDRLIMSVSLLGISIPSFILAPIFVIIFAIYARILPAAGWGSPEQIILPAVCLSLPFAAAIARLTRGSLLEVLQLEFIRTSRAKGLPERTVLFKHALKVAILPIISYSGPAVAGILTGSIVIEQLFGIPGIGSFFVNSFLNKDPFLSCGVALVYGLCLILFNLLADVLYFIVDRRVQLE